MACPMYVKWIGDKNNRNAMLRLDSEECEARKIDITNESWICLNSCDRCYLYQQKYPRRGHCPDPPRIKYVKDRNSGGGVMGFLVLGAVAYMLLKYFRMI